MAQASLPSLSVFLLLLLPVFFTVDASNYHRRWGSGRGGRANHDGGYVGGYEGRPGRYEGGVNSGSFGGNRGNFGGSRNSGNRQDAGDLGNRGGDFGGFGTLGGNGKDFVRDNANSPSQSITGNREPTFNEAEGTSASNVNNNPSSGNNGGSCPPARLACTASRTRKTDIPISCTVSDTCGAGRRCCFDVCLQTSVCKIVV